MQHVILVCKGFMPLLHGPVQDAGMEDETPMEKIRLDMANTSVRTIAPASVIPPEKEYFKARLLQDLEAVSEQLLSHAQMPDLSERCRLSELPVYGYLIRREALGFATFHAVRHHHQLSHMLQQLCRAQDVQA